MRVWLRLWCGLVYTLSVSFTFLPCAKMMEDYRSIPLEVLRDFALTQSEITSIRMAAEEVGIGHSTFHKFILARTTRIHPRIRRLLGLWYLRKSRELPIMDQVRPYTAALSVLLAGLSDADRQAAEVEAIAGLCSIYDSRGVARPPWLSALSDHLSRNVHGVYLQRQADT